MYQRGQGSRLQFSKLRWIKKYRSIPGSFWNWGNFLKPDGGQGLVENIIYKTVLDALFDLYSHSLAKSPEGGCTAFREIKAAGIRMPTKIQREI